MVALLSFGVGVVFGVLLTIILSSTQKEGF